MTLSITKTKAMGMEMWVVVVGGQASEFRFFSEPAARSKLMQLQQKIGA